MADFTCARVLCGLSGMSTTAVAKATEGEFIWAGCIK
jgi:hypothetical protein